MSEDGFFSRWSKRKEAVREGKVVEAEPVADLSPRAPPPPPSPEGGAPPPPLAEGRAGGTRDEPPPLTLEDARSLTPQSDFTPYLRPEVDPAVKNAAMKKLFSDPHFNRMDGLDIYIDDYGQPDPLPEAMLRQMASAKFLKLFDDEEDEQAGKNARPEGREVADDPAAQSVAESGTAVPDPAVPRPADPHADPDLRLQQDDAPGRQGPGPGVE